MTEPKIEQPPKVLPISIGAASEIGRREQNQDCMTGFSSPFGAVYLVADGMGGHRGGAEASRMVAEAFSRHLLAAPASSPAQDVLTLAIRLANLEILEKSKSGNADFEGMGSTVAIALIRQTGGGLELTTAHVGDSRIYLQRGSQLTLLTKDHTQVQWLIDNNTLDEVSARNHPNASVLTRAMGHTTDLQVDISNSIPLSSGDGILLCSDGLSGFVSDEDIHKTIRENPDPTTCANQLVQFALAAGGNDNITVQFLRIGNGAQAPSIRRTRKTQPDGRASVLGLSPKTPWLLLSAVVVLAVIAAAVWWVRVHRQPNPDVNAAQSDLARHVKEFQAGALALHDEAKAHKNAAHDALTNLGALKGAANKSADTRLEELKKGYGTVEGLFAAVLGASNDLEQRATNRSTDLEGLDPKRKLAEPERQKQVGELKTKLGKDETDLARGKTDLEKAIKMQRDLDSDKDELEKKWNAGASSQKKGKKDKKGQPDAKPKPEEKTDTPE